MKASSLLTSLRQAGIAAALSLAVAAVGSLIWSALLVANARTTPALPWSVPAMALVLVVYWWYLSGHGWPSRTQPARAALLRARRVPIRVFGWSFLAGGFSLVALAGLWIVLVELTGNGGNPTISGIAGYPAILVALAIAMGSLVSPLTEEAAFRGYAQVLLERRFSAVVAIVISSLFALIAATVDVQVPGPNNTMRTVSMSSTATMLPANAPDSPTAWAPPATSTTHSVGLGKSPIRLARRSGTRMTRMGYGPA